MLGFILVWLATIGLSFLPEKMVKPSAHRFHQKTIILQSLLVSMVFLGLTLIVQRPIFSGLAVFIFLIILVAVSNAKFIALKEPMVFSDFAMFAQAFKHPRLYFPFLGLAPVIIAPLFIIGLIILVLSLEPALAFTLKRIISTLVVIALMFITSKKIALELALNDEPIADNQAFGLQNSLYAYFLQSRLPAHKENIIKTLKTAPFAPHKPQKSEENSAKSDFINTPPLFLTILKQNKPNITVIQSESFFDARRLSPLIKPDLLKNYDAIRKQASQFGKLSVPAWGANTMRSEFTFLTGISYQDMGFYRYYPYQFIDGMPVSSVASMLRSQGYYCVCIHPHHASFFGRDRVFPQMGFDEFIDVECFEDAETFGPYISDRAVTDKILEINQEITDKPLFIFVITMENHGPLYLEKTQKNEEQEYFSNKLNGDLEKEKNDLIVYLRHLKNADSMIGKLTDYYRQSAKETTLCFYGDHVPSMPKVYQAAGYEDTHSDYFIWHSKQKHVAVEKPINIESLAVSLFSKQR